MKGIFIGLLFCCISIAAFGQGQQWDASEEAKKVADVLIEKYQLTPKQGDKMYRIQLRKYNQLNTIAPIKNTQPELYIEKLESLYHGTDGSIRLMLNDRQLPLYEADRHELRVQKAEKRLELLNTGKSETEIREILIHLEDKV